MDERVPALREVERLEVIGRYSLVAVRPRTGRLHQIRRHLKHFSCLLIGDVRYGKGLHNRSSASATGFIACSCTRSRLRFGIPGMVSS